MNTTSGWSREMEVQRLVLGQGYNSAVRPVPSHNLSLQVNFVLALTQVIDMVVPQLFT